MAEMTIDDLESKGWLDENGCCDFPEDVKAAVLGFKSPTLPITALRGASPEQLFTFVSKGYIKFIDGNGDEYTAAQYEAKYPYYPGPVMQLELRGKWPPK